MKFISIVLIALIAAGCNQAPAPGSTDTAKVPTAADSQAIAITTRQATRPYANEEPEAITTIKFPEFTITVPGYARDSFHLAEQDLTKDTIDVEPAEIAQMVTNTGITIETDSLADVSVDFCHKNATFTYSEGPVCVLYDWKPFVSEWESIPRRDSVFHLRQLTENDFTRFTEIDLVEWKAAVKAHCGEDWYNIIKNNVATDDEGSDVTIVEVWVRVKGVRKSDGAPYAKILRFHIPIGC